MWWLVVSIVFIVGLSGNSFGQCASSFNDSSTGACSDSRCHGSCFIGDSSPQPLARSISNDLRKATHLDRGVSKSSDNGLLHTGSPDRKDLPPTKDPQPAVLEVRLFQPNIVDNPDSTLVEPLVRS